MKTISKLYGILLILLIIIIKVVIVIIIIIIVIIIIIIITIIIIIITVIGTLTKMQTIVCVGVVTDNQYLTFLVINS